MSLEEIYDELVIKKNVLADYGNKKTYRLDGVAYDLTPMSPFPENEHGYKTYADYFFGMYKYRIKDKNQPLFYSEMNRT